ncbi:MAG: hypothetical protein KF819_31405 [Labilithrix sp.]|nr:hypothetical protein [Labilithrix sp.]
MENAKRVSAVVSEAGKVHVVVGPYRGSNGKWYRILGAQAQWSSAATSASWGAEIVNEPDPQDWF